VAVSVLASAETTTLVVTVGVPSTDLTGDFCTR
jgi:hypothetical protein